MDWASTHKRMIGESSSLEDFTVIKKVISDPPVESNNLISDVWPVKYLENSPASSVSQMSALSTTRRSFFKDVQHLCRTIDTSTDGQAAVEFLDDTSVRISLRPKSGCNAHATFLMTINYSPDYPAKAPIVKFDTLIYHPNIDNGRVCLSLFWEWQMCYSLLDLVKAILYLIDHPNFDGSTEEYFGPKFVMKSVRLLAGLPVDGIRYPPNTAWCEWARANNCFPTEEENDEYIWTPPSIDTASIAAKGVLEQEAIKASQLMEPEGNGDSLSNTWTDVFSDTIPSFAKLRHSIEDHDFGDSSSYRLRYCSFYTIFETGMHRIIIWQPKFEDTSEVKSVFYYAEVLCAQEHMKELGINYSNLFKGSLLHETQVEFECRQRSKVCTWAPYAENASSYAITEFEPGQNFHLNLLFKDPKPQNDLTSDFCPWSKEDGLGIHDLFGTLFSNKAQRGTDFTCFLDKDSGSDLTSDGIAGFFTFQNEVSMGEIDYGGNYFHENSVMEQSVSISPSNSDSHVVERNRCEVASISSSSVEPYSYHPMELCVVCELNRQYVLEPINRNLSGGWMWNFRQTRWPIRFAPQQTVELTTDGILLPPWRASAGRLLHDVNQYYANNPEAENLVLLDPMSISPLSPLLNLMRLNATPRRRLTGVLWMTPLQALSPNFHVPIPTELTGENDDVAEVGKANSYPSALALRFLTLDAYLTNWASWMSRIEVYSALGFSRPLSKYVTDPVAAFVLQPFSLGCGEAPIVDLWPLWLCRNIFKMSLHMSRLVTSFQGLIYFGRSWSAKDAHFFFPFKDIDEI